MKQAFLVTVRFYEGRYHGNGDWPPAPARLFQALLAGAARGATVPEAAQEALDWLEAQGPPVIAAPDRLLGQGYDNYVPLNDLDAKLSGDIDEATALVRAAKRIQPMLFDADASFLYSWTFSGENALAMTCSRLRMDFIN